MKFRKYIFALFIFSVFQFSFFSQEETSLEGETVEVTSAESEDSENAEITEDENDETLEAASEENSESEKKSEKKSVAAKPGRAEVPDSKRPKKPDSEKVKLAREKDDSDSTEDEYAQTIKYGLPSEISDLIDKLIENDDPRFTDEIYDLFQTTKNKSVQEKILKYFSKLEDPCLEDFAVEVINDPYDEKNDIVSACFQYISAVKTKEAVPAVLALIESENENYFNAAIAAIGEIGGPEEAVFLVEFLDRDDLSDAQRQILMRTCGKMHAVETWDYLVDILNDEDENSYVRMYAAEALGLMEKKESVPVLVEAFSATDPNLRQYVIKGLINFPDVVEAKQVIIQGIKDEHWRVRQESIKAVKEMKLKDAVPYLIYRAKNDSEKVIKEDAFKTLAALDNKDANDFLIEQLKDKKVADGTKKTVVAALIANDFAGEKEILELALECAEDDKRKDLRYAIGKELAKKPKASYEQVCLKFLSSKDTTTISLGLDIYKNKHFSSAEDMMRSLYSDKKTNASIKSRIKKMLEIEDE